MEMVVQGQKELTNADGGILFSRRDDGFLAYEIVRFDTLELRLAASPATPRPRTPLPCATRPTGRAASIPWPTPC